MAYRDKNGKERNRTALHSPRQRCSTDTRSPLRYGGFVRLQAWSWSGHERAFWPWQLSLLWGCAGVVPAQRFRRNTIVQLLSKVFCNGFSLSALSDWLSLIGSRALAAYDDVDGPSTTNTPAWYTHCLHTALVRSSGSAGARASA